MRVPSLFLFGAPRIETEERHSAFHRRRALALAAYLAARREPQPRDALLALLWPTFDADDARNNLRRELSHLRAALGDAAVVADRATVALNPAAVHADLWEFTAHLAAARAHTPDHPGALCDGCARSLAAAVDQYAADFLDGFGLPDSAAFDEWQTQEREWLRRTAIGALDELAAWREGRGEHEQAAGLAQRALALEPLHEPAHRALMAALAATGRRLEALRHYDRLRQRLRDEVGAEPEAETVAVHDAIRRGVEAGRSVTAATPTIRLPHFTTPFVGRAGAVAAIVDLLEAPETRLLTLVGPGGMGKTRLAVAAARALARRDHRFADGLYFVSLAGLSSAEAIPAAVAEGLGFTFRGGSDAPPPPRQLLDYLAGRRLLLVLDNIEHLLPGGESFPVEIDREAPGVVLLLTSRARLNVSGERLYPLGGLDAPPVSDEGEHAGEALAAYSAVALFVQTARRVRPDFGRAPGDMAAAADISRRLGGMPLAIELAAAWLEALTPAAIADEIGHGLDILTSDLSDVPDRQRSLRAVFDTSFRLLNEQERAVLPRLGVFRDGFTREAAEAVAFAADGLSGGAAVAAVLRALIHKSWLSRDEGGRFHMHDLLRQYAEEQLGEDAGAIRERHARTFARFLDELRPRLYGGDQKAAAAAVSADLGNVLAAWEWFARRGELGPIARQMLLPMAYYEAIRLWFVGYVGLLDRTLIATPPDAGTTDVITLRVARALIVLDTWTADSSLEPAWDAAAGLADPAGELGVWYVWLCEAYGAYVDRAAGLRELRRLLARYEAGGSWLLPQAQRSLGRLIAANWREPAEQVEALDLLRRAAAGFARSGNVLYQAYSLLTLAAEEAGLIPVAERLGLIDRVRELREAVGHPPETWLYAWHRTGPHIRLGRPERVLAELAAELASARDRGDRSSMISTLAWESTYARRYGALDRALRANRESLALAEETHHLQWRNWGVWNMGELHRLAGDWLAAEEYFTQAKRLFEDQGDRMGLSYVEFGFGSLALDRGEFAVARERLARYVELSWPLPRNRWNQVNGLVWLARADVALGRLEEAAGELREALRLEVLGDVYDIAPSALAVIAELALAAGRPGLCAALCAYLAPLPQTWLETRGQLEKLAAAAGEMPTPPATPPELGEWVERLAALPDGPADEWLAGVAGLFPEAGDV